MYYKGRYEGGGFDALKSRQFFKTLDYVRFDMAIHEYYVIFVWIFHEYDLKSMHVAKRALEAQISRDFVSMGYMRSWEPINFSTVSSETNQLWREGTKIYFSRK